MAEGSFISSFTNHPLPWNDLAYVALKDIEKVGHNECT